MNSKQIQQSNIIERLNKYFQYHGLSLHFDDTGICNGLCSLYAKYTLKNEDNKFVQMIQRLSELRPHEALTDDENLFIMEVFLTIDSREFNKKLSSANVIENLAIENKSLKSSLDMAMITNEQNWVEIIDEIALQEDEVILISSKDHIASISKQGNQYTLYDPNYGFYVLNDTQQLVKLLRDKVLHFNKGMLGMNLRLIQHPKTPSRQITISPLTFYDKYLKDNAVNENVLRYPDESPMNSLELAISVGSDVAVIKKLIEMGSLGNGNTLLRGIAQRASTDVFKLLFKHYYNDLVKELLGEGEPVIFNGHDITINIMTTILMRNILAQGSEEIFDALLADTPYNAAFLHSLKKDPAAFINEAAKGGNSDLLHKLILMHKTNGRTSEQQRKVIHDALSTEKNDFILSAIESGSVACLGLILDELKQDDYQLTPDQSLRYLLKAIKSNTLHVVRKMLDIMPVDQIKSLHISLSLLHQTNLPVLRLLQQREVPFSNNAIAIIHEKEHQWIHLVRWILMALEKMSDYFWNNPVMHYKHGFFKPDTEQSGSNSNLQTVPRREGPLNN